MTDPSTFGSAVLARNPAWAQLLGLCPLLAVSSTLINALLGDNVLPTGLGHTTRCFVQIQGTDETTPSLMVAMGDTGCFTETPVTSLQDIASALLRHNDDDNSLVILNWPRARCPLLQVLTNQNTA